MLNFDICYSLRMNFNESFNTGILKILRFCREKLLTRKKWENISY